MRVTRGGTGRFRGRAMGFTRRDGRARRRVYQNEFFCVHLSAAFDRRGRGRARRAGAVDGIGFTRVHTERGFGRRPAGGTHRVRFVRATLYRARCVGRRDGIHRDGFRFGSSSVQSRRRRAIASRSIDRSIGSRPTDGRPRGRGRMGVKRNPPAIDRSGFGRRVGSVWRFTIRECVCVPEAGKSEMWIDLHFR